MEQVQPRVYLLAHTQWSPGMAEEWFPEHPGARQMGLEYDDERIVEAAGRRCYRSFSVECNPNLTRVRSDAREYVENLLKQGHGSVLEHFNMTFAFEGVSRVFTHELVRHRAGCAYSQESLRYVRPTSLSVVLPPELANDPEVQHDLQVVEAAAQRLTQKLGLDTAADFPTKKRLTSAVRRLLPQGMATGIVATFNMRALRHIIEMRANAHAEWEMQVVFDQVCRIIKREFPLLCQDLIGVMDADTGLWEWHFEHGAV